MSEAMDRFDIRLPAHAKQLLMEAAEISGNTLTALVLNAALDKAREVLQSHRHFILNAEEWRQFTATLDDPPESNDALRTAWRDIACRTTVVTARTDAPGALWMIALPRT